MVCCSWPCPFVPLVFLGCLDIFGCLFVFKVDGLIGGGQCQFLQLREGLMEGLQRPALSLRPESGKQGEIQQEGEFCGYHQCQRLPSRVQNSLLVLPVQLMPICVWFRVCLGEGWPASCSKLSSPSSLRCHPQSPLLTVSQVGTSQRGTTADS